MNTVTLRKQASKLVLAIALATGTAMVAGHVVPDEAHAQRKKKKDKKEKESKPEYSKEFVAAFTSLDEQTKAEGADVAALRPQLDQVMAMAQSGDEKFQSGLLAYNMGVKINDLSLRLLGMETMLASGKTPLAAVPQYNFIAFQTASVLEQPMKARGYLQQAINLNYSTETTRPSDLLVALAQNHFNTDEYVKGLEYLDQAIAAKKAAGEPVEERLYEIAFSVAYREDLQPQVYDYAVARAIEFPSDANWTNAINVVRVLNDFEAQPTLDILRLSRMAGVMTDKQEYIIYVETADARRLPQEVKDVIEQGYAIGAVERDDTYIADQLRIATDRIATDREELPVLEADASAADAGLRTVVAAGNAFLSYGEYAKATKFYEKALGMPGVDTEEVLTRLGIAQVGQEDYAGAKATFGKITGTRMPIARVWSGYASAQAGDEPGAAETGPSLSDLMDAST